VVGLGLSFKKSGLDLDRKIWQSAHHWSADRCSATPWINLRFIFTAVQHCRFVARYGSPRGTAFGNHCTTQLSVRVIPLLYLIFLLMYLDKIVCQNFGPLVMYITKSRQGFTI